MSGYTPIFNTVFDGSLCGKWPDSAVWLTMLALCDKRGEVNLSYAAIAARTGWPMELLRNGVGSLMQPDPDSQSPDEEGRRLIPIDPSRDWGWRIVNHLKYRDRASGCDQVADGRNAAKVKRYKERHRRTPEDTGGHPETPTHTHTQTEDSRRAASGEPTNPPDSLDKALYVEARKVFGESIGGKINQAVREKGKPWIVGMIEQCRSKDPEAARAYFIAALAKRKPGFSV